MSNWAKLQEDLTGLPVYKRAKHGIHFDKGGGEVLAHFSGRPCHYEDAGIWKPIDTKLLALGDGYYGCPHSKVQIHPDGRMRVTGTDYAQRVELPSAKTGLLDGDKMVRKFSFGEQRLWVTEDGFKSEIQLNRIPTLTEAKKLIATESGTLSKKYIKGLTTAKDSKPITDESPFENRHTITTLTAFRTWLSTAVFPVIIDPDFSAADGSGGDTFIEHTDFDETYNNGANTILTNQEGLWLLRFDLSSIGAEATCTAVSLKFKKTNAASTNRERDAYVYSIANADADWVEGTKNGALAGAGEPCWNAKAADGSGGVTTAWGGGAGAPSCDAAKMSTNLYVNRADAVGTVYTKDFNAAGIAKVQGWFGKATNGGIFIQWSSYYGGVEVGSSENSTEGNRPILSVTYTASGIAIPIVQYYNRLRRN